MNVTVIKIFDCYYGKIGLNKFVLVCVLTLGPLLGHPSTVNAGHGGKENGETSGALAVE